MTHKTKDGFVCKRWTVFTENELVEIREQIFVRKFYHKAPDDVFELALSLLSDFDELGRGKGGLNALRLVNRRCKRAVDSCTAMLGSIQGSDGPFDLPAQLASRCKRIQEITCFSWNLSHIEGCPRGLKRLCLDGVNLKNLDPLSACFRLEKIEIYRATLISDLSPLRACASLKRILVDGSRVVDLSPISSLPLLEELIIQKEVGLPSVQDLNPLSCCSSLREISIGGNDEVEDLSPLSCCRGLEEIRIDRCTRIFDLAPLSTLSRLKRLFARGIDPRASFLALLSCPVLMELGCCSGDDTVGLDELKRYRPDIKTYDSPL